VVGVLKEVATSVGGINWLLRTPSLCERKQPVTIAVEKNIREQRNNNLLRRCLIIIIFGAIFMPSILT